MKYLTIDRILRKEELLIDSKRTRAILKEKIQKHERISENELQKIDKLFEDIQRDDFVRLVSIRTPFEGYTPMRFDFAFNYENLEQTENVDISVQHILFLQHNYLSQFPRGHHCEIFVKCSSGIPKLFNLLSTHGYSDIKIGICNTSDWKEVKNNLQESKKWVEGWKKQIEE